MYVYVCMCVYIHIYKYTHIYISISISIYLYIYKHFIHSFCSHVLAIVINTAVNTRVQIISSRSWFQFLWIWPEWNCWIIRWFIYNFWATVIHSDCTNLHSHTQCIRIPFSLHLHQHLLPLFFILVILTGMTWYLTLVLIGIFLSDFSSAQSALC